MTDTAIPPRPLFRSLDQCLKYAFSYGVERGPTALAKAHRAWMETRTDECPHGDYERAAEILGGAAGKYVSAGDLRDLLVPVLNREELPMPSRDPDLDRLPDRNEAPAQVGLILGFVYRQPRPERQHLIAKYAFGDERAIAQKELRDYLLPLVDDMVKPRYTIYLLVARFYGLSIELSAVQRTVRNFALGDTPQDRARLAEQMVDRLRRDVDEHLQSISMRTEDAACSELRARGVIL